MRKNLKLVLFVLILAGWTQAGWAQGPPPPPPWGLNITAPGDVGLTVERLKSTESAGETLTYTTEATGYNITVSAAGTGVAGARLYIKGGDLLTYALLIIGSRSEGGKTLAANVTPGIGLTIAPIKLKLDATGVAPGASGLNTLWVYTLTYTIQ